MEVNDARETNPAIEMILAVKKSSSYDAVVKKALETPAISVALEEAGRGYEFINIADIMERLGTTAELVNLAYMGTHGFPSNVPVTALLARYQSLATDSKIACSTFVMSSLKALDYHHKAIAMLHRQKPALAFKFIALAAKIADDMSTISSDLVEKASAMCTLAATALEKTACDNTTSNNKKAEIRATILQLQANRAALEESTKRLRNQIEEARENEAKAAKQADEARSQAFTLSIISAVTQPLSSLATLRFFPAAAGVQAVAGAISPTTSTDPSTAAPTSPRAESTEASTLSSQVAEKRQKLAEAEFTLKNETDPEKKLALEKEIAGIDAFIKSVESKQVQQASALNTAIEQKSSAADSAAEREAAYHTERMKLQEQERTAAADLQGSLVKLKGMQEDDISLDKAIVALEVATKSLARITTAFENVRVFWHAVHKHCLELADTSEHQIYQEESQDALDIVQKTGNDDNSWADSFADSITQSWYSWLALSRVNRTAQISMEGVVGKIHAVMSDLSTKEEAKKRYPALLAKLTLQIEEDVKLLEAAP